MKEATSIEVASFIFDAGQKKSAFSSYGLSSDTAMASATTLPDSSTKEPTGRTVIMLSVAQSFTDFY